jgi:1,4-alpha-glucan branching enzyme
MSTPAARNDGMGALLYENGTCRFRVWAPFARRVRVEGEFTNWQTGAIDLASEGNGNWSADVPDVKPLQLYKYLIDNAGGPGNDDSQTWERADARALQVESSDVGAASYVVPPFDQSSRPAFSTPAFENFILYQLHVGSFAGLNDLQARPILNRTATFLDIIDKLDYIRRLGFNGIALLPIGDVHDDLSGVGAGYGTCDMFAPEDWYATSKEKAVAELLQLVDAAHSKGLAIIFDVVYNHAAITDNRYWRYDGNCYGSSTGGEYFENGHDTRFGNGFGFWQQEVKDFFLDNARMFLGDYRADGLRFDAVQFIQPDAIEYIIGTLRHEFPDKYLIAEYNPGDPQSAAGPLDPFGALGFDATWDLASPGQAYNALSGSAPVDNLLTLIGDFQNPNPWRSVRYLSGSHDQIYDMEGTHLDLRYLVERFGGRGNGWALAKARLAYALNVALPGTPMLFMGSDGHLDGYWDPDNDHGEHRVDWAKMGDPIGQPMQRLVSDVNNLRWRHPALRAPAGNVTHVDRSGQVVAFKRYTFDGDLILVVVNASDSQWSQGGYGVNMGGETGVWQEAFNSQAPLYGGIGTVGNFGASLPVSNGYLHINLPSWSVLMFTKS